MRRIYSQSDPPRRGKARRIWRAIEARGWTPLAVGYNSTCWGADRSLGWGTWWCDYLDESGKWWGYWCGVDERTDAVYLQSCVAPFFSALIESPRTPASE